MTIVFGFLRPIHLMGARYFLGVDLGTVVYGLSEKLKHIIGLTLF